MFSTFPYTEKERRNRERFYVEECLMRSNNRYYISGLDMLCLSVAESIWEKRRKNIMIPILPVQPVSTSMVLTTPPLVQRQLGTPVQDENVWNSIMGPSQYSAGMTVTPSPTSRQTPSTNKTTAFVLTLSDSLVFKTSVSHLLPSLNIDPTHNKACATDYIHSYDLISLLN